MDYSTVTQASSNSLDSSERVFCNCEILESAKPYLIFSLNGENFKRSCNSIRLNAVNEIKGLLHKKMRENDSKCSLALDARQNALHSSFRRCFTRIKCQ